MQTRILVVEDEKILQKNILRSLQRAGFLAIGAACLYEARQALRVANICAILLDVGLPDGDGLEFLEQVRRCNPHLLVVILTAQDAPEIKQRAYQLGVAGFLCKPISLKHVRDTLLACGVTPQPEEPTPPPHA